MQKLETGDIIYKDDEVYGKVTEIIDDDLCNVYNRNNEEEEVFQRRIYEFNVVYKKNGHLTTSLYLARYTVHKQ